MQAFEKALKEGVAHFRNGEREQAEKKLEEAVAINPKHFNALHILGVIALQTNRFQRGADFTARALESNHKSSVAYSNLGYAFNALKRPAEALACCDRSIALEPNYAVSHNNRGSALKLMGLAEESLADFDRAVELDPQYAEAHNNRGNAFYDLSRFEDALQAYAAAFAIKPAFAEAYNNRGNALQELKRFEEANASYDEALALKPDYPQAYSNKGSALNAMRRHAEALECCDKAIELLPDYAEAFNNRANILNATKRHREAVESYDRAIQINPSYAEALSNRANALSSMERFEEAIESFERTLVVRPKYNFVLGNLAHTRLKICDWRSLASLQSQIFRELVEGKKVITPFPSLSLTSDVRMQRRSAEVWSSDWSTLETKVALPDLKTRPAKQRIRIGYFSADFHNHATSYLIAELFERHDRSKFEIIAYSFGMDKEDDMRRRIRAGVDRFVDVNPVQDVEILEMARTDRIDIAVDLKGYTKDARPNIFMNRTAPIQMTYLGYPGPTAAGFADYVIADATVIPPSDFDAYAEKVIWLPDSYQVNDLKREIGPTLPTRSELQLPEDKFVFCCFNNPYKITPGVFERWMKILSAVEGSVLWLLESHPAVTKNLRKTATRLGVSPERLVFASYKPLKEHLARYQAADLFLDTLPYNAHTTASDSLWAGVPVLTQMGQSFAGRVAASLLKAVGLEELIVQTPEDYTALAIDLARSPEKLAAIRARLKKDGPSAPLFDIQKFTNSIESAYSMAFDRYTRGLAPDHIRVA